MQASIQPNVLVQADVFIEEPEREDCAMEVELGVNLVDAFSKKHVNFIGQPAKTRTPTTWGCVIPSPVIDAETCGLLPAECSRDSDRFSSSGLYLDDVAQEVLTKALLEAQDITLMEVDNETIPNLDSEDPNTRNKLEMVVFLYAFEKFRIVYA